MSDTALRALRRQWMLKAHQLVSAAKAHAAIYGKGNDIYHRTMQRAETLHDCARELDAVLSKEGRP